MRTPAFSLPAFLVEPGGGVIPPVKLFPALIVWLPGLACGPPSHLSAVVEKPGLPVSPLLHLLPVSLQ